MGSTLNSFSYGAFVWPRARANRGVRGYLRSLGPRHPIMLRVLAAAQIAVVSNHFPYEKQCLYLSLNMYE